MLNIYYGRENINKSKFIFETIKDNSILIVPNQSTLQTEKEGFLYTGKKGLMDIEILSFNRLANRVLSETGGGRKAMINKTGRHMILSKILKEEKVNLKAFEKYFMNNSFIELTNNFISELKQYGATALQLEKAVKTVSSRPLFAKKLNDLSKIYSAYEKQIEGKYIDTEDYVNIFCEKIKESSLVSERTFWVSGFDYFAPKNFRILEELEKNSIEVNVFLTYDDSPNEDVFSIGKTIIENFKKTFDKVKIHKIEDEGPVNKSQGIKCIEENLFKTSIEKCQNAEGIKMCYATNYYAEGETVATQISKLIREKGYRYSDIAIICNDQTIRGNIYKRIFDKYGIKLFIDEKRNIMHIPAIKYLSALLDIIVKGYKKEDFLKLLKTRLSQLTDNEVTTLEEYVNFYGISGRKLKDDFVKCGDKFTEEDVKSINENKNKIISPILALTEELKINKTIEEKVKSLYSYLAFEADIPGKIENLINEQEADGAFEFAEETSQVWNKILEVLEQLIEIIGDEKSSIKNFSELLMAGISSVEIALLPPTVDGLVMGTMQRTRIGKVKALFVLGANDGVLPASVKREELLSEEEKIMLKEEDFEFSKLESLRIQEENLAIYKNLSKPEELLYISCSASDEKGLGIKPSHIFNKIIELFQLTPEEDIIAKGEIEDLIISSESSLFNLVRELREGIKGKDIDEKWKEVIDWHLKNKPDKIKPIAEGLFFENKKKNIDKKLAEKIYIKPGEKDFTLSPSRIEKYGKCPFAHFINYGLKAKELREYKVDPIDMGNLYHICLMELSNILTEEKRWHNISYKECEDIIERIFDNEIKGYRQDLFFEGGEEKYRSRKIKKICAESAWAMIDHVRKGEIEEIKCEVEFGKNCEIPPIEITENEKKIYISGKIDRLDLLPENAIKIIDYKSGNDEYKLEEAMMGVKLQLFIYMHASEKMGRKPIGAFYFYIKEPMFEIKDKKIAIEETLEKSFKMDGVLIGDEKYLSYMDNTNEKKSNIIPSLNSKANEKFGLSPSKVLSEEKFQKVRDAVENKIIKMAKELVSGNISIEPKKIKNITTCAYCKYKGICKFDVTLPGFNYSEGVVENE